MHTFDVIASERIVGKVTMVREGLYYRFRCVCTKLDGIHRLWVMWENDVFNLGVCLPIGDSLLLEKKVAANRIGNGPYYFVLKGDGEKRFAPLDQPLPTECLRCLKTARFAIRDGRKGLIY